MKERSSVTRTSGMTRREWWLVTPHGRIASNSGCTVVLVDGARTANLPRGASESVTALECHALAGGVMNRDEYAAKLKAQIDQWNAEAAKWEAKARQAQAGMQAEFERQLEQFRARRDAAITELKRLQGASTDAWREMTRGADAAVKGMQEALDKARREFNQK
jgi:hypothetical protein